MVRFSWIFVLAVCAASCAVDEVPLQRFESTAMGTSFVILVDSDDDAGAAAAAAFERIAEIDARFSDYQRDSEASRLGVTLDGGQPVDVSSEMLALLVRSRDAWRATSGAFDVTLGAVTKLWRRASRQDELPDAVELRSAIQASGFAHLTFDERASTVQSNAPGLRFDFGAIAKGYALDEALDVLVRHGFPRSLVDGGGDLALGDAPRGRVGWRIEIPDPIGGDTPPLRRVLSSCGVATSGDLARGFTIDATRYSHILDARTGQALTPPAGATAIAPDAITADIAASAATVVGVSSMAPFCERHAVEVRHVRMAGGVLITDMTAGFALR